MTQAHEPSAPATASAHAAAYRPHQVRMLALATVAYVASSPGQSFLISVFVDDFLVGTGLSRTTFSALYAAGTVVSAVSMLMLGRVVDRRGLRVAWCVVALTLAVACGLASVAAGALLAFVALALLRTAGQGSFTLVGTLLLARSFERRRGQAVALANLGATVAAVALPPLVAVLIVEVGWRAAYQVLGAVLLVVVLPLAALVRPGPDRAGAGAEPAAAAAAEGASEHPTSVRVTRPGLPDLPSAAAARLLLVLAAPPLVGTAITFHAVAILADRGVGFVAAGAAVGLLGATSAVGVVVAGVLVDRLETRTTLRLLSAVVLVGCATLLLPQRPAAYVAFVVLGLGMGAVAVVNATVWARTFGTVGLGRLQGAAQSSTITAAAAAPLVPALSVSLTGSFQPGLLVLAVVAAASLLLALAPGRAGGRAQPRALTGWRG